MHSRVCSSQGSQFQYKRINCSTGNYSRNDFTIEKNLQVDRVHQEKLHFEGLILFKYIFSELRFEKDVSSTIYNNFMSSANMGS